MDAPAFANVDAAVMMRRAPPRAMAEGSRRRECLRATQLLMCALLGAGAHREPSPAPMRWEASELDLHDERRAAHDVDAVISSYAVAIFSKSLCKVSLLARIKLPPVRLSQPFPPSRPRAPVSCRSKSVSCIQVSARVKDALETIGIPYYALEIDARIDSAAMLRALAKRSGSKRAVVPSVWVNGYEVHDTLKAVRTGEFAHWVEESRAPGPDTTPS